MENRRSQPHRWNYAAAAEKAIRSVENKNFKK